MTARVTLTAARKSATEGRRVVDEDVAVALCAAWEARDAMTHKAIEKQQQLEQYSLSQNGYGPDEFLNLVPDLFFVLVYRLGPFEVFLLQFVTARWYASMSPNWDDGFGGFITRAR